MMDFKNMKIVTSADFLTQQVPLLSNIVNENIKEIEIVKSTKPRKKDKRVEKRETTKDERVKELKQIIDNINEIDDETNKKVMSKKEAIKSINDFIINTYVNEKKELNI